MLLACIPLSLHGQIDSSRLSRLAIDLITISAAKQTSTESSLRISSAVNDLPQLLTQQSNIYIKSYGLGSLATLSLWGGNASQTLIEWEGISISNPMLGLTDLSLIPLHGGNKLSLRKGGLSAEHGSGAMTGVLSLAKKLSQASQPLSVGLVLGQGSFGNLSTDVGIEQSSGRFAYSLNGFYQNARNNFSYKTKTKELTQANADLSFSGLKADGTFKINEHQKIGLNLWFQESEKGIPPTTVQTTSVARQEDLLSRAKLHWTLTNKNYSFSTHLAFLDEQNNYADTLNNIAARNRFQKKIHHSEFKIHQGNTLIQLLYNIGLTQGFSDSYEDESQRLNSYAIYGSLQQQYRNIMFKAGVRKEWRSFVAPPLVPTFSLAYKLNNTTARIKLSKEFRAPTLNEVFWVPGGNRDLQPEIGWNQELRLENSDFLKTGLEIQASLFHRKIKNWILWAPLDGQSLWSPYNLGAVRSYGLDIEGTKTIGLQSLLSTWTFGYNYNRSENLISIKVPTIGEGDQLIYTPKSKLFLNTSNQYKKFEVEVMANYTSSVRGINEELASYLLISTGLSYSFQLSKIANELYLKVENITNKNYRVIERRPMPGRYYKLTWSIKLQPFKKNK